MHNRTVTEGNTTTTLHDESLDAIIAVLRGDDAIPGQERRDAIAATIEAQR